MTLRRSIILHLSLIVCMSTIVLRCNRECIDNTFAFDIELNIKPKNDSINVGDTLWFESVTSTTMTDITSNKEIIFDNATNMGYTLRVSELLGTNNASKAVSDFDFIIKDGQAAIDDESARNLVKSFKFKEENEMYKLRFGMICKKKGIYGLGVSDAVNVFSPRHGSCNRAGIHFRFKTGNSHLYYLQNIYYGGNPVFPIDLENSYCFKVK
jgi:hypothetical protein